MPEEWLVQVGGVVGCSVGKVVGKVDVDFADMGEQSMQPVWFLPNAPGRHDKRFVDFQDDVTADDVALAQLLLDYDAEREVEADWGHTPLEWAATLGSEPVAGLLLDAGALQLNLWTAAALGMLGIVQESFDGEAVIVGASARAGGGSHRVAPGRPLSHR